jgi:predicted transcriptional regulator
MRIYKNQTIAGIRIIDIRNYFSQMRSCKLNKTDICSHFNLNYSTVNVFIKELIKEDFIIETNKDSEYELTMKGQALCIAKCVSPMSKPKADKIYKVFGEIKVEYSSGGSIYEHGERIHSECKRNCATMMQIFHGTEDASVAHCYIFGKSIWRDTISLNSYPFVLQ